jgi:hypothetical protein
VRRRLSVIVCVIGLWSMWITAAVRASGWSIQPTPNPAGATAFTTLSGVSCPSVRDCTAVGYYEAGNTYLTLAEQWNGTRWEMQPIPNPDGALNTVLSGVSCADTTDCMAVGDEQASTFNSLTVAERWNGSTWQLQSPPPSGQLLESVSCPTRRDCVAVGYGDNFRTLAEVWNGTSWSVQPTPNPPATGFISALSDISCRSPSACTAVGDYETIAGDDLPLVEHWSGRRWKIQPTPDTVGALSGVSCRTSRVCAAVGGIFSPSSPAIASTLAERWNGFTWELQPAPNHAGSTFSELGNVSCPARRTCVALGGYTTSPGVVESFTEVWNGNSWTIRPVATLPAPVDTALIDISCPDRRVCTAVGIYFTPPALPTQAFSQFTLAERFSSHR